MSGDEARIPIGLAHGPLTGRMVRLRPATEADVPAFTALFSDPTVHAWWRLDDPAQEARQHAAAHDPDVAVWAVAMPDGEAESTVVGLIQAYEEDDPDYRHGGIDIALRAVAQGRGLGGDAVRTVARWLIEVRGHHRLVIDPAAANARAIRTYGAVGFRPVGILRAYERGPDGTFHDGLLMDLLAEELDGESREISGQTPGP